MITVGADPKNKILSEVLEQSNLVRALAIPAWCDIKPILTMCTAGTGSAIPPFVLHYGAKPITVMLFCIRCDSR